MDLDQISAAFEQVAEDTGTGMMGWDAICAIDLAALNQLLFALYLHDNPAEPVASVNTGFTLQGRSYLLDLALGPPNLGLSPHGDDGDLGMSRSVLTGSSIVEYDAAKGQAVAITHLGSSSASVTGIVGLAKVDGTVGAGSVVLKLGAGTWTLDAPGLDADVRNAADAAVTAYYQACPTSVTLCAVASSSVSPSLQPTSFELVVQPHPDPLKGGGCVLVLITTNGQAGQREPLATYPIPDGSTAALLVSNQVIFAGLLPAELTNTSAQITWAAAQAQSGTGWSAQISSGSADVGVLHPPAGSLPYTSDGEYHFVSGYHEVPMKVPLAGFTLQAQGGALQATHTQNWGQQWAYSIYQYDPDGPGVRVPGCTSFPTAVSYHATSPVTIADPSTCVVTFPWSTAPTCTTDLSALADVFDSDPGSEVVAKMQSQLTDVFEQLTVAEIDTFALQNLLFYPNHALALSVGSLPGDLLLTGLVVGGITVEPSQVQVAPGGNAVQFTAQGGSGSLEWSVPSGLGSFSTDGVYTPPATHAGSAVVKVSVSDGTHSGGAVILLGTSGGNLKPTPVSTTPLTLMAAPAGPLSPGGTVTVSTSDPHHQDGLHWVAAPPGAGTLTGDGATASFTAAPAGTSGPRPDSVRVFAYTQDQATASFGYVDLKLAQS